jgi:quercetin dioxygenase-like cupin family protein
MEKVISNGCLSFGIFLGASVLLTAHAQSVTHRVPMFENAQVKVWKTIIIPNSPLSMHRHEHGRTIVVLKGGTLTIQQDTGEKKTIEWKTGQAYWLDADPPGKKQHADVNETNDTIEVMVIEDKRDK